MASCKRARTPRAHASFVCRAAPSALCFTRRKWRVLLCLGHFLPVQRFPQVLPTSSESTAFSCPEKWESLEFGPGAWRGTGLTLGKSLFYVPLGYLQQNKNMTSLCKSVSFKHPQWLSGTWRVSVRVYVFMYLHTHNTLFLIT